MSGMMKFRSDQFAGAVKRKKAAAGSRGGGVVTGRYDQLWIRDRPITIFIPAHEPYTQEVYNRELQEVETVQTPWFQYEQHFLVNSATKDKRPNRRGVSSICSRGPHLQNPCWSCAYRSAFFEALEEANDMAMAEARERGTKFQKIDEAPPVSKSSQFALNVTVLEPVYQVPLLDKDGNVRRNRKGEPIYNPVPESQIDDPSLLGDLQWQFGHNYHWSFGITMLTQLSALDEMLRGTCASCVNPLSMRSISCLNCNHTVKLAKPLKGKKALTQLSKLGACPECRVAETWQPDWTCTCGEPAEGALRGAFALTLWTDKVSDTQVVLHLDDFGIPELEDEEAERINKLIESPLDLPKIFAPTPLDYQKEQWDPAKLAGLTASYGIKTPTEEKAGIPYDEDA